MGRVVRCLDNGEIKQPMYVAAAGIHLYSSEELSYFLQNFLYLIDESFFDTELMRFLREELKRCDLADLVLSRVSRTGPVALAGELALAIGDMDESEQEQLKKKVVSFQKMSDSGRKRLRADMLLKKKEYDRAAEIYLQLLERIEQRKDRPGDEETGMIYYNLGKIYMTAFEWKKAGNMLVKAYEYLREEAVLQELFELSCISPVKICDESVFSGIHAITLQRWQESLNRKTEQIEKDIAGKDYENTEPAEAENSSQAELLFRDWKRDFRKISKSCCQGDIF